MRRWNVPLVALIVGMQIVDSARAGPAYVESQERALSANVIAGLKPPQSGTDSEFAAAINLGSFDATAQALVPHPTQPPATAMADQSSILLTHSFVATGKAHIFGSLFVPIVLQGVSTFNVKFSVWSGPTQYSLRASLWAIDWLVGGESGVTVTLARTLPEWYTGLESVIFADVEHSFFHDAAATGWLEPGEYMLSVVATASAMYDDPSFASFVHHMATYSVELNFGDAPSADFNDDEVVNGADLVLVLDQ